MRQIIFTVAILFSLNALADPVVKLNELMSAMATLQVKFNLEVRNASNNELIEENSGALSVKRPGFFHVHTKEPYEQFIISDQQVIWTYDVDLEQVDVELVDERLQQTPFLLLSGDVEAIRKNFAVGEPETKGKIQRFHLSPQDSNASYDKIELRFDNRILTAMQWSNTLGEISTIEFSDIKVNTEVPDSLFQFKPPSGVTVDGGDISSFQP